MPRFQVLIMNRAEEIGAFCAQKKDGVCPSFKIGSVAALLFFFDFGDMFNDLGELDLLRLLHAVKHMLDSRHSLMIAVINILIKGENI